jgi:hypothetical protein
LPSARPARTSKAPHAWAIGPGPAPVCARRPDRPYARRVLASAKGFYGEFTLPGLLKVTSVAIPAKKKRRRIDPFTKVEREFAAKPATARVKVRSLKKLKDAAL